MLKSAQDGSESKQAHRDRRVGERMLGGRADHWWDPPCRAGTRTATPRKLTDISKRTDDDEEEEEEGEEEEQFS